MTASNPLFIRVFGGYSFSVGYTRRNASSMNFSLSMGEHSYLGTNPLRAVSSSLACAYVDGKSISIHPFFSIASRSSNSLYSSSILAWITFGF